MDSVSLASGTVASSADLRAALEQAAARLNAEPQAAFDVAEAV
jgi:hypothetical protein